MGIHDDYIRQMQMMQQAQAMQSQYPYQGALGHMLAAPYNPPISATQNVQPEPDKVLLLLEEEENAVETI